VTFGNGVTGGRAGRSRPSTVRSLPEPVARDSGPAAQLPKRPALWTDGSAGFHSQLLIPTVLTASKFRLSSRPPCLII
jgi:hypothetical protein